VLALQDRFTWLLLGAVAVRLPGWDGGVPSGAPVVDTVAGAEGADVFPAASTATTV
jgi:hypothetical protein